MLITNKDESFRGFIGFYVYYKIKTSCTKKLKIFYRVAATMPSFKIASWPTRLKLYLFNEIMFPVFI